MHEHAHTAERTTWFSILGNLGLATIKALAGIFGNSFALVADAIESAGDTCSSILVLIGIRYANKLPDANHPYGHGRAEPLVTFIVVGFLIVSAVVIAIQSIDNIRNPHEAPESYTLWILGGIIMWKEASYRFVIRRSKETNSSSLKADAWHHRSDALTSIAAFIGISIAVVGGPNWVTADDWAALAACALISYNGIRLFRPALDELMDTAPSKELEHEVREVAAKVPGVIEIEKCRIRKMGLEFYVDIHVGVDETISVREGHEIAHAVKNALREANDTVADVLVHIEPSSPISD